MKYLAQLAVAALVLFSVSAALSVWLQQSRQQTAEPAAPSTGKAAPKESGEDHSLPEPKTPSKASIRPDPLPGLGAGPASDPAAVAALRDREARLERRAAQVDLILRDLHSEREVVTALVRQLTAETKQAAAQVGDLDARASEFQKRQIELQAAERKNIDRMAGLYDAMAAESAAPILKQMADSGRLDTAVKVLAQMKERQAAKVLSELGDPSLAAQMLERMRGLKTAAPAGAASNLPLPAGTAP